MSSNDIHWHTHHLNHQQRARLNQQQPAILWFTGLSGAGKSTIANLLEQKLYALNQRSYLLDGDNLRHGLCQDLNFTPQDRSENIRRVGEVAKLFVDAGLFALVALISPSLQDRQRVRQMVLPEQFIEVFVQAPLALCEARDPKELYKKARAGQLQNFTGIDAPYQAPPQPELTLNTQTDTPQLCVQKILNYLSHHQYIQQRTIR